MSAAAVLALATAATTRHGDTCTLCGPPATDRPTAGCSTGRILELTWARAWRDRVIALTDRRMA